MGLDTCWHPSSVDQHYLRWLQPVLYRAAASAASIPVRVSSKLPEPGAPAGRQTNVDDEQEHHYHAMQ